MKTKILLWSVVSILILGLAAGAFWWLSRPQVITFSDDSKVTLLAGGIWQAPRAAIGNQAGPGARGGARGNSFTTDKDTLVIWVREQYDTKQYH